MIRAALLALLLLVPLPVLAQTPITVLGTGRLGFDLVSTPQQPITLADVQGYTVRVYLPATVTAGLAVPHTCAANATTPGLFNCDLPLSGITTLTTAFQSLALTTGVLAVEGVLESPKVTAPFELRRAAPPVAPQAEMSIRP